MLRMMKQTVNDGYGMSFKDGCENEQNVAYKYYKDSARSMLSDISDQSVRLSKFLINANHILASKVWYSWWFRGNMQCTIFAEPTNRCDGQTR